MHNGVNIMIEADGDMERVISVSHDLDGLARRMNGALKETKTLDGDMAELLRLMQATLGLNDARIAEFISSMSLDVTQQQKVAFRSMAFDFRDGKSAEAFCEKINSMKPAEVRPVRISAYIVGKPTVH